MSNFVRMPLEKKYNRKNLVSRIEKLEILRTAQPSSRVTNLTELSKVLSGAIIKAIGTDGTTPVIINGQLGGEQGSDLTIDPQGIWVENQQAAFGFEDTNGDRFNLYMYSSAADSLGLLNNLPGKYIILYIRTTDNAQYPFAFGEDGTSANTCQLTIPMGASGGNITMGTSKIWAGVDGVETVFNNGSYDIDHRFEGATDPNLLVLDGGLDAIGIGVAAASGYKLKVNGSTKVDNIRTASFTIADDAADSFLPSETEGVCQIFTGNANDYVIARYRSTPSITSFLIGSNTVVTTGVLAGTTGTDGRFTVSAHTDGRIYVENRTGSSRTVYALVI